jgi:hypothetical protein
MALLGLAFVVGYLICYFIIGPILLNKHKIRSLSQSYLWLGNMLNVEAELRDLSQSADDSTINRTLWVITASKYAILLSVISFIVYGVLRAVT